MIVRTVSFSRFGSKIQRLRCGLWAWCGLVGVGVDFVQTIAASTEASSNTVEFKVVATCASRKENGRCILHVHPAGFSCRLFVSKRYLYIVYNNSFRDRL
jgi:hypothetical protein